MLHRIIALLCAVLLSGCITMPQTVDIGGVNGPLSAQAVDGKVILPIDPVAFLGVRSTADIEAGNFTVVYAKFPDDPHGLLGEFDARRISYPVFAVGPDGREYPAQALFAGFATCEPTLAVLVEGTRTLKGFTAVLANTARDQLYNLKGVAVKVDAEKFRKSGEYRRQVIAKDGSSLERFLLVRDYNRIIQSWTLLNAAQHIGKIRTPYPLEFVQGVARINPQHSHTEKFIATTSGSVNPLNPMATVVGVVMEYIMSNNAPALGWTGDSLAPRGDQAFNIWVWRTLERRARPYCQ
ncbi:MAG: hypothetical protein WAU28_02210 [Candidatus Moraniibacteriota bacterium]